MMWMMVQTGNVMNRVLLDIGRNFRRNRNQLNVIFGHVELKTFASWENFPALNAFERRNRSSVGEVEMDLSFMHDHVAVSSEGFVANVAL
jgi:hypothetical protein